MKTSRILSVLALSLLTATTLCAQPPGGGRGDRGERGGDRGGDRGGGEGGFRGGGFPGGGGFGGRGGGGPGGGGFGGRGTGGGGPPGGGFSGRGGPGGGGPPGGGFSGRGGRGGSPGGDPSSFLSRLDANGNGIIDVSEQQGPAQFLISRLSQSDPSIQAGKPIPLSKLTEGFEKMRGQRDAGGGNSTDPRRAADEALMPELLVPGFGTEEAPVPLLGFGATAEMLSVPVTADDEREAAERMRRYDRNKDGFLTKEELSSRFSGNPMDFDRNRDGKLSQSELAVRYARRREGEEEARSQNDDRRRDRGRDEKVEIPDVYNQRKSYRALTTRQVPDGVPGFFIDKDANDDGQVSMAEFSSDWNDETLAKFFQSDLNRDGVITADEALRGVELGSASTMASVATAMSSSSPSGGTSRSSSIVSPPPVVGGKPDPKYVKVVERIVTRYDKNNDKALTASEWGKMLMSPAAADTNRDGRITIDEYALWMQTRQKK